MTVPVGQRVWALALGLMCIGAAIWRGVVLMGYTDANGALCQPRHTAIIFGQVAVAFTACLLTWPLLPASQKPRVRRRTIFVVMVLMLLFGAAFLTPGGLDAPGGCDN